MCLHLQHVVSTWSAPSGNGLLLFPVGLAEHVTKELCLRAARALFLGVQKHTFICLNRPAPSGLLNLAMATLR